jgi:hypothetical protein
MSRNTTIALVVIFGALLLYLLAVQLPRDRAAAAATPTAGAATEYVWTASPDQVNAVRIEDRAAGRSVAFTKDAAGTWSLTEPVAGPADAEAAAAGISRLTGLVVNSTVTSTTDLSHQPVWGAEPDAHAGDGFGGWHPATGRRGGQNADGQRLLCIAGW